MGSEDFLSGIDADWARAVALIGPCLHAPKPGRAPYEALIRAIAYQQLTAKAGDAILGRFCALWPDRDFPAPGDILSADPDLLRGCGFSARKTATIRAIAQATLDGLVPPRDQAMQMTDEDLVARITTIPGIGRWTVEMLLIYTLARPDILPADDFGLRAGYRLLKALPTPPTARELARIGAAWSPHRSAASWYLWRLPEALRDQRSPSTAEIL